MNFKTQLYQNCSDLTMDRFIGVIADNDYKLLIKRPGVLKVKEKELLECWDKINSEYSELVKSDEQKSYLVLLGQKVKLETKIYLTRITVESLLIRYNADLCQVLINMGYDFKFSKKTYMKDISKVMQLLKPLILELSSLKIQLQPFQKEVKIDKNDFLDVLVMLGKHSGYALKPEETTVQSYVIHLNNYKRWQTAQKSPK